MNRIRIVLIGVSVVAFSSGTHAQDLPRFVERLKAEYEQEGSRLGEVWEYRYRGETVYYLPKSLLCCDIPSELYSDEGTLICQPDGGLTGAGDGKCPDFIRQRSGGTRIWPLAESIIEPPEPPDEL